MHSSLRVFPLGTSHGVSTRKSIAELSRLDVSNCFCKLSPNNPDKSSFPVAAPILPPDIPLCNSRYNLDILLVARSRIGRAPLRYLLLIYDLITRLPLVIVHIIGDFDSCYLWPSSFIAASSDGRYAGRGFSISFAISFSSWSIIQSFIFSFLSLQCF